MKESFTVHDLPVAERPRERLAALGVEALSTQELLALILGQGVAGESVMTTAQKLLSYFGSLEGIMNASLEDLQNIRGLGSAKASQLKACFEVARRATAGLSESKPILSPRAVYDLMHSKIGTYAKEHFALLSLDVRSRLLGIDTISVGTLTASLVHPRETFEVAIRRHAARVIVAHNHPSGDLEPSLEDIEVTKRLAEAGRILDIELSDHIIVTKGGFISFKERGLL